ncbi:MAG: hypothetical protein R3B39_01715 [Candidatus Paceibacterota bacterium]
MRHSKLNEAMAKANAENTEAPKEGEATEAKDDNIKDAEVSDDKKNKREPSRRALGDHFQTKGLFPQKYGAIIASI